MPSSLSLGGAIIATENARPTHNFRECWKIPVIDSLDRNHTLHCIGGLGESSHDKWNSYKECRVMGTPTTIYWAARTSIETPQIFCLVIAALPRQAADQN